MNLTLFDLDHTLIEIDSDHGFGEFMVRIGWADAAAHRARNDAFYADYVAGRLDQAAYIEFATAPWRDLPPDVAEAGRERFLREVIDPVLRPPAHELVRRHREAGDTLAIVTSTNEFITRPIAERFGVETLIATELARDAAGRVTGAIRGVPAFRAGKVVRLEQWLAARGQTRTDFERITFYSDSTNDLPLLEWATHPVATNPSAALAQIAAERRWPILRLFEPPKQ
ncbi:MAG TPA: HAD family hydrolase [Burkholderiaceae bacterium]|nr:HAD family hydrolase [Burkholderiaceae bacterium]